MCDNCHNQYSQSAKEIDPGYRKGQTILTAILLSLSVIGLLITIMLMLPVKQLRSTRAAKVNLCFCLSLLLASSLFLLQNILIKEDDTGVIKLVCFLCYSFCNLVLNTESENI